MRTSGTKPSSVILSKIKLLTMLKSEVQKVPNQTEAKTNGIG